MSDVAASRRRAGGLYPERRVDHESGLDRLMAQAVGHAKRIHRKRARSFGAIVEATRVAGTELTDLSDEELAWRVQALRPELRARGFEPDLVARSFALVREFADRRLGMRHYDAQIIGGWVLLGGMVAEMATGEGKTLVATLPACTLALAGVPVHVITVNDYLARRDSEWMRPVYEAMGVSVGTILHHLGPDDRREVYRQDVTYCTNKEIVFDYLRDRLALGRRPGPVRMRVERLHEERPRIDRLRLRGLCFAIVDEADSVLIDEARTPLIISGPGDNTYEAGIYRQALDLAGKLESGTDFFVDFPKRQVELTGDGEAALAELAEPLGGFWNGRRRREEMVRRGLAALHLYHRDKHYVVQDGRVQIVDEYTGRVMPGRSWEGGLHQLVESKEECPVTTQTEILGRISYQRFFRRYLAMAGMTGTAREAASEFWSVYRLEVVSIPTHRPLRRTAGPSRLFRTADDKWEAVVRSTAELHRAGRPVLIGTRHVADSQRLSERLEASGLEHRVLNALQDEQEAEIIAGAGQPGQITVATNMAGRGTDIKLGDGVAERGGLHVIATEYHEAGRIDRQLFGRCGRQGDPGSYEAFASLEDELLRTRPSRWAGWLGPGRIAPDTTVGGWLGRRLFRRQQRRAERANFRARRTLSRLDDSVDTALAFSGEGE